MEKRGYGVIALMSVSLIALELSWTRLLSAEFFYTFAFLVLSLAVLGLGLGSLALRLFPGLGKEKWLSVYLTLAGLLTYVAPILVFKLGVRFSQVFASWTEVLKLLATILLLSSTFFFGGMGLALLFKTQYARIKRLYMADLLGAAAGVIVAILAMNYFGTPAAAFLISLPILAAAVLAGSGAMRIVPLVVACGAVALCPLSESLLERERPERARVVYKHWDAMSKIKVYDDGQSRGINIDNIANSPVYSFDGNWDRPDSLKFQFGLPVDYLIGLFDSCTFLSLGAGGGADVLQALQEGAVEVHAVEVNPHINRMMIDGDPSGYLSLADTVKDSTGEVLEIIPDTLPVVTLPEYSGNIYHDPRVTVVTEDARAYVRRFENKFDIIYSLSSNTWTALASGSFALAENYLFTTEAFRDYWHALSDSGFLVMEHQFYMPRLVSEVMEALDRVGVEDAKSHFAVYNLPHMRRNVVVMSRRPLDDTLRYHAIYDLMPEYHMYCHLLYPASDSAADSLIQRIVDEGWQAVQADAAIDLSPCTDDRPFIAQMGRWENLDLGNTEQILPYEFYGFPLTKLIIAAIVLIVLVIIVPLLLVPYWRSPDKLRAVPWLYFFFIGAGFMMIEVVLIQKYALFVGPSVYSLAAVLLTLLVSSGVGSRFAGRFTDAAPFIAILVWLGLDIFVFGYVVSALAASPMALRILVTCLLLVPLGFAMGMPFPKATERVKSLIDWGFAVNGAASVLGSVGVVFVAFTYGFPLALALSGAMYAAALGLFLMRRAW